MYELSVTRLIDAAPDKVWKVLTERTNEWWCPKPWRAEVDWGSRAPGGRTHTTMHGPNGEKNEHPGFILAWDEGRRIAVTDAIEGDLKPAGPFMLGIWEIAPEGSGTRYTGRARHWTSESMAHHKEMGFDEGWGIMADQFKELCEAG
ncbi:MULTISPECIES: SRPBCC domain-containing protein [unclassified Novosphingobium]|uniref:SRPBCC domain-containing protein n=1 Tax=unclassified Novosphingobium TaxID=2644732 RepID=UPI000EC318E2|nr:MULTISPECIES: SRPBCC domain-containing protein [unclassified Novosphingobium]HCF24124.1 ATPase [Novosphingobium sp.]HQV04094.1 SRPBCC domain-containing protein [Novosphingobium sp.]